jgi:hypothetical protein
LKVCKATKCNISPFIEVIDQGLFGWLGMIFTSNGSFVCMFKCEKRRIENAPSFSLNKIVQIFIPRFFSKELVKDPTLQRNIRR